MTNLSSAQLLYGSFQQTSGASAARHLLVGGSGEHANFTAKDHRNSCIPPLSRPAVKNAVTVGLRCLAAVIVSWDLRRRIRVRWRTARGDLGPWLCERRACVNRGKHPETSVASCSRRCEANPRHRAEAPSFLTPKPMMTSGSDA